MAGSLEAFMVEAKNAWVHADGECDSGSYGLNWLRKDVLKGESDVHFLTDTRGMVWVHDFSCGTQPEVRITHVADEHSIEGWLRGMRTESYRITSKSIEFAPLVCLDEQVYVLGVLADKAMLYTDGEVDQARLHAMVCDRLRFLASEKKTKW